MFEDSSWEWTDDRSPREEDRDPTARMFLELELLPEEPTAKRSNVGGGQRLGKDVSRRLYALEESATQNFSAFTYTLPTSSFNHHHPPPYPQLQNWV